MKKKEPLDLSREELEKILQESWDDILSRYHYPLIKERPIIQWNSYEENLIDALGIPRQDNITCINLETHKTKIAEDTLKRALIMKDVGGFISVLKSKIFFLNNYVMMNILINHINIVMTHLKKY